MTDLPQLITRLKRLEFDVQDKREMFGQTLPMLRAVAIDRWACQLALVAEDAQPPTNDDDEPWRELIFAVAGLRHHLRGSDLPAFGAPVLLALVDEATAKRLRRLVEEIAEDYALFVRIDINIVPRDSTNDGLDEALAPLLPKTREAVKKGVTVASQDVEDFWDELEAEIEAAAKSFEKIFGKDSTAAAATQIINDLRPGVGEAKNRSEQALCPVSRLRLENFRSFADGEVDLPAAAVIYGANGSGKTSICEALEILWSGRTQRIPEGVKSKTYEKHLNHEGKQFDLRCEFSHGGGPGQASELDDVVAISLGRAVLPQHALDQMASGAPKDRFEALLIAAGLDLPDLQEEAVGLRKAAHAEANSALDQAGLKPIRAVNVDPVSHLREALKVDFNFVPPDRAEIEGAAVALTRGTDGAYSQKRPLWKVGEEKLAVLLGEAGASLAQVCSDLDQAPDPSPQIEEAIAMLKAEAAYLTELASPLRRLSQCLGEGLRQEGKVSAEGETELAVAPVPSRVAARWLSQARGLERSIAELEGFAVEIADERWRRGVGEYLNGLRDAAKRSSAQDLEAMTQADQGPPQISSTTEPSSELLIEAGFARAPKCSEAVVASIDDLLERIVRYAASLDALSSRLERHPGRAFVERAARIMPALCNFALARDVTQPTGAITRARETLVKRLLDGRLSPIVRELVSALVRFEWYFKPMEIAVKGRNMGIHGLASNDPNLDVRYMLNEAERTVVGIAFFLALHILQPTHDRRVLVLDDPASSFDAMNKAAFVATLRSLLRMLEPDQFLITTHDETMVALLEQELGKVGDWPVEFGLLRCQRTDLGVSAIGPDEDVGPRNANLDRELQTLAFERDEAAQSA